MTARSQYFWYYLFFFFMFYVPAVLLTTFAFIVGLDYRVAPGRPNDEGLGMALIAVLGLVLDLGALLVFRKSWPAIIVCGVTFLLGVIAVVELCA